VKLLVATTVSVSEARRSLHALVERVQRQGESYIITRYGEPAAALVPVNLYENWRRHQREIFFDLVRDLQKEADLSPEDADRVAGHVVAGIRAEG
jgi:prevent-host-death family protein